MAAPTAGPRSGVNDSGPQKSFLTPTVVVAGTRAMARSRKGAMRSQSGSISPKAKSDSTPPTDHVAASGSNSPTISPAPSGLQAGA